MHMPQPGLGVPSMPPYPGYGPPAGGYYGMPYGGYQPHPGVAYPGGFPGGFPGAASTVPPPPPPPPPVVFGDQVPGVAAAGGPPSTAGKAMTVTELEGKMLQGQSGKKG